MFLKFKISMKLLNLHIQFSSIDTYRNVNFHQEFSFWKSSFWTCSVFYAPKINIQRKYFYIVLSDIFKYELEENDNSDDVRQSKTLWTLNK